MNTSRLLIVVITALGLLTSCHSARHTVRGSQGHSARNNIERPQNPVERPAPPVSKGAGQLVEYAKKWIGVPYRYGGNNRSGIDCSGFTCVVYKEVTGICLPRSSREQSDFCKAVERNRLKPGDLVFFTSSPGGNRINHVAIFIGDNSIIHSTTSRGVIISSLDEDYWRKRYFRAGRVTSL